MPQQQPTTTTPPEDTPDVHWIASWGDKIKVGDLVKVAKFGGPVRVTQLRRLEHNHPRPVVVDDADDGHWIWGAIVEDVRGREFHTFINPTDPVFIGLATPACEEPVRPKDLPTDTGDAEGITPDGDIV